ncbi:MAG: NAD(+)/NADH kinase [Eubacterium sp.]|nr:NAD(+)/NADH kinase [Eubacterium sp.]
MKKFVLIVNAFKDRNLEEARSLCSYIQTRGASCQYLVSVDEQEGIRRVRAEDIPQGTECILVLGGDGTLIRAARDTVKCGVPLIGVNMGTLGYLCELETESVYEALDLLLHDEYMLEERMMICGWKDETFVSRALNDIVIHRTGSLALVRLTVYVNGQYLNTFQGDGMIISTPTGSTGYNMSAGGPIVDPKAQLLLLTPINSHTLTQRSIVIDPHDEVVVEVEGRHTKRDEAVQVSFDGDHGCCLRTGECIRIQKAQECAKILKISRISFLEILRKKMQMIR